MIFEVTIPCVCKDNPLGPATHQASCCEAICTPELGFEVEEDHVKVPIAMTKCPNKMSKRINLIYVDCLLPIYLLLQGGQSCKGGGLCSTSPLEEVDGS